MYFDINQMRRASFVACFCLLAFPVFAQVLLKIEVSEAVWSGVGREQQSDLMSKFENIEIIPSASLGIVQSVQLVNRSAPASTSGARAGAALAGSRYIDRSNKREDGYSATQHLKNATLGAALGSVLDAPAIVKFVVNYGVKSLDGGFREIKITTADEFTRPVGQCVYIPSMEQADTKLCTGDVALFIKSVESLSVIPAGANFSRPSSGINVKCRVPGAGLMTLEKNACIQMEGVIEK